MAVGHQKQTFMETPVQVCVSPTIPIEMGLQKTVLVQVDCA